ncbi:hypothetical protein WICPIJ_001652 [Wickerhamomyces pijperi]|uniref:DUF962-domain-containing protein n=1 Tax=Wickerhamomyces pijperi TaxID=599730 RepID=A0A9P8QCW5_WICPI|nr:hypothetical protein WICPIJ_001652 [Wickerhamomyces pijperi]
MSSTVKESSGGLWNLPSQLAFYRSYHHDPINVLIHALFIPTILYTSTGILANVQLPYQYIPDELKPYESYLNLGSLIIGVGYAGYYLLLDWRAGIIAAPVLWAFVHTNVINLSSIEGYNNYLWTGFVIGWIVQFIGHGFFEKRAPALLDNLLQALVLAPFFVVFEAIFLLGLRSELRENMEVRALENIEKFKEANKKKL